MTHLILKARMFTGLEVISCVHPGPLLHHFPASYKILIHFAPGKSFFILSFSSFYPYCAFYSFLHFPIFPSFFSFYYFFFYYYFSLFFLLFFIFSLAFQDSLILAHQRFVKGNKNGVGCS